LTVSGSLQDSQTGWSSPDIRYEWVRRQWPSRSLLIIAGQWVLVYCSNSWYCLRHVIFLCDVRAGAARRAAHVVGEHTPATLSAASCAGLFLALLFEATIWFHGPKSNSLHTLNLDLMSLKYSKVAQQPPLLRTESEQTNFAVSFGIKIT